MDQEFYYQFTAYAVLVALAFSTLAFGTLAHEAWKLGRWLTACFSFMCTAFTGMTSLIAVSLFFG